MIRLIGLGLLVVLGLCIAAPVVSAADISSGPQLIPDSIVGVSDSFDDAAIAPVSEEELAQVETENAAIPEPTTLALMGFGMAGIALRKRFMA